MRITTSVGPGSASPKKMDDARPPARRSLLAPRDAEDLAQAGAALARAPSGGPLGLHAVSPAATRGPVAIDGVADRLLVGKTRDGLPEVRLELAAPGWRGTEVRLVAGVHGLEATLVVTSEAARRVVEAQLVDLARALEARGLHVARCQVAAREDQRRDDERQRRRQRAAALVGEP